MPLQMTRALDIVQLSDHLRLAALPDAFSEDNLIRNGMIAGRRTLHSRSDLPSRRTIQEYRTFSRGSKYKESEVRGEWTGDCAMGFVMKRRL